MAITSLKDYKFASRDHVSNFNGNQLLYSSWDQHLLFAAPFIANVSPDMTFGDFIEQMFKPLLIADPDAEKIDWDKAEWLKDNQPWTPDFSLSLKDNGVGHKDHVRLRTPGLNTLMAAAL